MPEEEATPAPQPGPTRRPATAAFGDEPVRAYIAGLPPGPREIVQAVDALAARTLPGLERSVKWDMAHYGVGDGWCFSCGGSAAPGVGRRGEAR